jgi:hypothetical protein
MDESFYLLSPLFISYMHGHLVQYLGKVRRCNDMISSSLSPGRTNDLRPAVCYERAWTVDGRRSDAYTIPSTVDLRRRHSHRIMQALLIDPSRRPATMSHAHIRRRGAHNNHLPVQAEQQEQVPNGRT